MSGTSTITRSQTEAESDRDGEQPSYVLDKETGITTTADGKNEQMWVLTMQPLSREELPVCGALLESSADKGEVPCLRKVSEKVLGIDAAHRHDLKKDTVRTCYSHRGTDGTVSKYEFAIPSIWRLTRLTGHWEFKVCNPPEVLEFLESLPAEDQR